MSMTIMIVGLIVFLGVHSVRIFAPGFREARIAAMGPRGWHGVYTVISVIGFVLIVWGFAGAQPLAPVLYVPNFAFVFVNMGLMAVAFVCLAIFALPPGILKPMLKHPMLIAVKVWAVAHLLVNGDLASVILFTSFLAWAVLDRISEKRRGTPGPAAGPVRNDILAVVIGLAVWVLFIWKLHEWLIGVPVVIA